MESIWGGACAEVCRKGGVSTGVLGRERTRGKEKGLHERETGNRWQDDSHECKGVSDDAMNHATLMFCVLMCRAVLL